MPNQKYVINFQLLKPQAMNVQLVTLHQFESRIKINKSTSYVNIVLLFKTIKSSSLNKNNCGRTFNMEKMFINILNRQVNFDRLNPTFL